MSAILCYTATGSTALRVARERPKRPVIGLTPVARTAQRLALVWWGIETVLTGDPEDLADMVRKACPASPSTPLREGGRRRRDHVRRAAWVSRRDQHDPLGLRR